MGRPPKGFQSVMFRLMPDMMKRIKRVISLKKKEKDASEYARNAIVKQLEKDEKKLGLD